MILGWKNAANIREGIEIGNEFLKNSTTRGAPDRVRGYALLSHILLIPSNKSHSKQIALSGSKSVSGN